MPARCSSPTAVIAGLAEGAPQGVPDGATLIDAKGLVVAPGLIDMRVFTGEPGHEYRETLATRRRRRGGGWRHQLRPDAGHGAGDRRRRHRRLHHAPRRRDREGQRAAGGRHHQGLRGEEITEFGLLKEAGAVCLTDGRQSIQSAGLLRAADELCGQFRHAGRCTTSPTTRWSATA